MKLKLFSMLVTLFGLFSQPIWAAQFSPGQEGGTVIGGGNKTMLNITQVSPGKVVFTVTSLNAVYLDKVPANVKAHFADRDASGKGKAYIVDVASNPALAKLQLCWRGVGSDWGTLACGPINAGRADVTIDVGQARVTAFALVPVLMDGKTQVAWAAHPENTRVMLDCPKMKHPDMASVFVVKQDGTIAVAGEKDVAQYQKHYATFCQR